MAFESTNVGNDALSRVPFVVIVKLGIGSEGRFARDQTFVGSPKKICPEDKFTVLA
jgi:hypothetical protein